MTEKLFSYGCSNAKVQLGCKVDFHLYLSEDEGYFLIREWKFM